MGLSSDSVDALDRHKVIQVYVDVGKVLMFRFVALKQLHDYSEALLPQYLNRVDRCVEHRHLILAPLLGLQLHLGAAHALHARLWPRQEPVTPEVQLEETGEPNLIC